MDRNSINLYFLCFTLILISSCGTFKKPYYSDDVRGWASNNQPIQNNLIHSLYLIGDGGELDDTIQNKNYVLDAASELLKKETTTTSLVFLGDNVYPHGLPKAGDPDLDISERILNAQLQLSRSHQGMTYLIPGNHDWNKHKKGGRKAILRQEEFVKNFDAGMNKIKFYPPNACGDPEIVKINKDLVYIFLDSQWWLQDWSREKKMNQKCEIKSRGDLLKRMEEIFVDHKNDEIVVMLHHPIMSNGKHGGHFGVKHHLFPLTELNHNLWIPLPIIGSLYPIYRNVTGSNQDITHIKNKELMQGLDGIAKKLYVNVTFISGHEHGMQYFDGDRIKYIVSGGGSRHDYVKEGGNVDYARAARGFAKINFYENNESWLEMYTVSGFDQDPILEFRTQLRSPRAGTVEEEIKYPPITETTKTIAANTKFAAGPIKKLFFGSQYRDIWTTPVDAEVIDLETKLGGLTPIKKGGGQASNSLRMEKENGKQYILRSIKKDYSKLVPSGFSNLKIMDVLSDQNSASQPYGALIIPALSEAAGVFYTEPKLVYLQHQRGLRNYNSQFPEELYLLEERPSGNWSDAAQFGNSPEIIGYADLLDILTTKKNHFIDQDWVLKSRMFDLFIHDWDRHDDQWRWAKFDEEDKHVYRPIPRDRDQALYKFKGIVPWLLSITVLKQFKAMKKDAKDAKHLAFNARHFDRYFLHDLEWSEWEVIIDKMQKDLSDSDIDNAMNLFPKEVMQNKDIQKLPAILKARRENLMKIGRRLYDYLSEEVEITGSDHKDRFEIEQSANGNLIVKHFVERKDEKDLLKYERTFYPEETNEVRLYGLRGKDKFIISGAKNNAITLRIIGGEDDDIVHNQTSGRKVYGYDDPTGMDFEGKVIDKKSTELEVNEYDRNGFVYNTSLPGIRFGNTVDDGFWIGASFSWTTHAWRKDPYKAKQGFSFSVAPGNRGTLQFGYSGHFPNSLGSLDFSPAVDINFPHYENYFGFGGNSVNDLREIEYNWVRMKNIDLNPLLRLNWGSASRLDFGPTFRYRNLENSEGRITDDEDTFFTQEALNSRAYIGGTANFNLGFVEGGVFPTNGFTFSASATHLIETSKDEDVTEFNLESQMYVQILVRPKLVVANMVGFMASRGDRQFYHYPSLGNNKGLRGYRNERFRGTSAFYNNLDLRLKLFKWDNNIIPMDIGILGGFDIGKVYFDDELGNPWLSSRTVGIWMDMLGVMILQPYYSFNNEQNTFSLQLGFSF